MIATVVVSIMVAACSGEVVADSPPNTLPAPVVRIVENAVSLPETGAEDETPTAILVTPETTNTPLPTDTAVPATQEIQPPPTDFSPAAQHILIGAEIGKIGGDFNANLLAESGIHISRHNGLQWSKVEPFDGERSWEAVSDLEQNLIAAADNGLETILIIRGTPAWAQKIEGSVCGPVHHSKIDEFTTFMVDAVERYSHPPYNVKYWELGNEPDIDPTWVPANSVYGCWGNQFDEYLGGGYYAEMLKSVYPAMKAANPDVKILLGGLLLDCDPGNPPEGKNCAAGNFLEGVLRNGGGEYFDILSYHGYAYYIGPTYNLGNELHFDDHHPSWGHRGGVVLGKAAFLRQVMADYNVDKPLFLTEGSLLCHPDNSVDCYPPGDSFFEAQADYIIRLIARSWANDLAGIIWYQFDGPGWRYGGLLDENLDPKPAFRAVSFLSEELSEAKHSGLIANYENLEGYKFTTLDKTIWVLWSTDEIDTLIQLPDDTIIVYNKYGENITPENLQITINDPVFIEFAR